VECANGSSERAHRSSGSSRVVVGSRNVNITHISFPMHRYGELKLTHLLRLNKQDECCVILVFCSLKIHTDANKFIQFGQKSLELRLDAGREVFGFTTLLFTE
jgi:5-deoxy-D-glucuronate isomerase